MERFMNDLAEDLDSELLAIPFDAWLLVCERTMQRILTRFDRTKYQPITEAKARLWYLRYRHHCAETYTDFLKSVINCNAERSPELDDMIQSRHPNNNKTKEESQQAATPPSAPTPSPPPASVKPLQISIVDYDVDDDAMSMVSSICGVARCTGKVVVPAGEEKISRNGKDVEVKKIVSFRFTEQSRTASPTVVSLDVDESDPSALYSPLPAHRRCADWEAESDIGSPPALNLKRTSEKLVEDWEKEIMDDAVQMEYPEGSLKRFRKGSPYHALTTDVGEVLRDSLTRKETEETKDWYTKPRLIQLHARDNLEWKKHVLEQLLVDSEYIIAPNYRFEDPRFIRVENIKVPEQMGSDQSSSGSPDERSSSKLYNLPGMRVRRKRRESPNWDSGGDLFSEIESKSDSTPDRSSIGTASFSGEIREQQFEKTIAPSASVSSEDSDISDDMIASSRRLVSQPIQSTTLIPTSLNSGSPSMQSNFPVRQPTEFDASHKSQSDLQTSPPRSMPFVPFHLLVPPPPLGTGQIPSANCPINIPSNITFHSPLPIRSTKSRPIPPPPPIIRKGGMQPPPATAISKQDEFWRDWQRL